MTSAHTSRRSFLSQAAILAGAASILAKPGDVLASDAASPAPAVTDPAVFTTHGPAPTVSRPMHTHRRLPVETVTPANFAPFGWVLTPEGRHRLPINTYGDTLDLYREEFASDQPIEWFIFSGRNRGYNVLFLERHQQLTQTFIPVNGKGFYTIVAPPNCREENGFPALDELRAFYVPSGSPIQIFRGTWHENPLPREDGTNLLVTSHANLTMAHQQNPDPRLKDLPRDLERRWYRNGGYDLTLDV